MFEEISKLKTKFNHNITTLEHGHSGRVPKKHLLFFAVFNEWI